MAIHYSFLRYFSLDQSGGPTDIALLKHFISFRFMLLAVETVRMACKVAANRLVANTDCGGSGQSSSEYGLLLFCGQSLQHGPCDRVRVVTKSRPSDPPKSLCAQSPKHVLEPRGFKTCMARKKDILVATS